MEASTTKMKTYTQAKPVHELFPELCRNGINSTVKKQPRSTMAPSLTSEKRIQPMTFAEMRADFLAMKPKSFTQPVSVAKKKGWNSSVKIVKKTSHTSDGQLKNNPVRKVLNFQPKPKPVTYPRSTMYNNINNTETPKFPKPEFRAKKSVQALARSNSVRISGICNIPPTPVGIDKPNETRIPVIGKENNPYKLNINKNLAPPTPKYLKRLIPNPVIETPISNSSWKSGSDTSFIQREKEIHEQEEKFNALTEEPTLENIAEVSPPISTPFKEYRSVQEYFNNSSCIDNSALYNDNTIMCFDKPSTSIDNDKKEESSIVTLCDLFTKATMNNSQKITTELQDLLELEKQTENNIKMLEIGLQMLNNVKEEHKKSLQRVRKKIEEQKNAMKNSEHDKTLVEQTKEIKKEDKTLSPEKNPITSRPCSVIKSPSYKIPRKSIGLRKKIIYKSMPNMSSGMETPVKTIKGKALNMYNEMKKSFHLSTPMVSRDTRVPDTPALISHNLQKQLDKLYNRS